MLEAIASVQSIKIEVLQRHAGGGMFLAGGGMFFAGCGTRLGHKFRDEIEMNVGRKG